MSLTEALVVVGTLVVLAALFLPLLSRARAASRSAACLSHLGNIAAAFQSYARDNHARYPDPAAAGVPWERMLSPYAKVEVFRCPADAALGPIAGSSYDWRDTGVAGTTLAGRRSDEPDRPDVTLEFDALPGWHEAGRLNAAFPDGSARSLTQAECLADLNHPVIHRGGSTSTTHPTPAAGRSRVERDGSYRVTVAGAYEGAGTANVLGRTVTVRATVVDANRPGKSLSLAVTELPLDPDGAHFAGAGRVGSLKATFVGRLDGHAGDPTFSVARLLCTYTDANGRAGRVVGVADP